MRDTEEICDDILERHEARSGLWALLNRVNVIYAPPAEPSDTNIVRRKLMRPIATNTGGQINDRDRLTNQLLKPKPAHLPAGHPDKHPQMVFNRETTSQLAWEMRTGYRWPEHKSETKNASENPLDKDNHGPEALGRFTWGHLGATSERRHARQSSVKARRK